MPQEAVALRPELLQRLALGLQDGEIVLDLVPAVVVDLDVELEWCQRDPQDRVVGPDAELVPAAVNAPALGGGIEQVLAQAPEGARRAGRAEGFEERGREVEVRRRA